MEAAFLPGVRRRGCRGPVSPEPGTPPPWSAKRWAPRGRTTPPPLVVAPGSAELRQPYREISARRPHPRRQPHTESPRSPISGWPGEHSGNRGAAALAGAGIGQLPFAELVPVALDEAGVTARAPGAASLPVVHVAGVDVVQAVGERDVTGASQRRGRRARLIQHLPVRVKRREVQRHVGAEPVCDPARQPVELVVGVVLPGDQQRRDLEPYRRLSFQVFECLEHWCQRTPADLVIEALREGFEIDVRGVHEPKELSPRLGAHVARSHGHAPDAARTARAGGVDRVLHEHDRIVVGKGNARAAEPFGGIGELLGTGAVSECVHLAGLGHVPVLAIRYRHERDEIRVVRIVDLEIVDRPLVQGFLHAPYWCKEYLTRIQPGAALRSRTPPFLVPVSLELDYEYCRLRDLTSLD